MKEWLINFHLLDDYYQRYRNSNVSGSYVINEVKLGSWVNKQRLAYKNKKLSQEQIQLLNSVDFDFNITDTKKLKQTITNLNVYEYNKVLNARFNNILNDLSDEANYDVLTPFKQKEMVKKFIRRIWH